MNKINSIQLITDKADIHNLHIRTFYKQCVICCKVHNVTDCSEKGESRSETLIYASPLCIDGNTVENHNFEAHRQKHSHTYKYTHKHISHKHIYTILVKHTHVLVCTFIHVYVHTFTCMYAPSLRIAITNCVCSRQNMNHISLCIHKNVKLFSMT